MLTRSSVLPAGLCIVLAASLIALPGCSSRSKKKEAKVDSAPTVTAKGSAEVAAEEAAAEASQAPAETAEAPSEPTMGADSGMSTDMGGSTRGRAFEEATASGPMDEQAPSYDSAPAPVEEEAAPAPAPRRRAARARRAAAPPPEEIAPAAAETDAGYSADAGAEADGGKSYVVVRGDTISRIARTHGTNPKALMAANHISDPRTLKVGQKLIIP